jgi:adenine/guanine phosphoribosyltransferase-like PRPP-binding protein
MVHVTSDYLEKVFHPKKHKQIVDTACDLIKQHANDAEYIVMTGLSGMLVGAPVAMILGKQMVVVRKTRDSKHSATTVENIPTSGTMKYVILDDFICSGKTLETIQKKLKKNTKAQLVNMGVITYASWWKKRFQSKELAGVKHYTFSV